MVLNVKVRGAACEQEDLPNAIKEALEVNRRRKESGVRSEGKKSPMLELVAKAIGEMMKGEK